MLSHLQRRKLMEMAHAAYSADRAAAGKTFDDYRHEQLKAAGVPASTKDMNRTGHFDKAMLHLAIIAGHDQAALRYAVAMEKRYRYVIGDLLAQLGQLEGTTYTFAYARGICGHMKLPLTLEECPFEMLGKIIQALDTQRRRILAARGDLMPQRGNAGLGSRRRDHGQHGAHGRAA